MFFLSLSSCFCGCPVLDELKASERGLLGSADPGEPPRHSGARIPGGARVSSPLRAPPAFVERPPSPWPASRAVLSQSPASRPPLRPLPSSSRVRLPGGSELSRSENGRRPRPIRCCSNPPGWQHTAPSGASSERILGEPRVCAVRWGRRRPAAARVTYPWVERTSRRRLSPPGRPLTPENLERSAPGLVRYGRVRP
jgi:hypothetical protein